MARKICTIGSISFMINIKSSFGVIWIECTLYLSALIFINIFDISEPCAFENIVKSALILLSWKYSANLKVNPILLSFSNVNYFNFTYSSYEPYLSVALFLLCSFFLLVFDNFTLFTCILSCFILCSIDSLLPFPKSCSYTNFSSVYYDFLFFFNLSFLFESTVVNSSISIAYGN